VGVDRSTVRAAGKRDIAEISTVMARAFEHDPPFVWMLPDERGRRRRLEILFITMLRWETLPHGGVEVACAPDDGRILGAALWLPPGHWRMSPARQLLTVPASLRAFGRRVGYGSAFVTAAARVHPVDPHWYLHGIGVDPSAQGQGVGGALLRSRLDRCDAAGIPAYLESSKPANVPLYERFGFTASGRLKLPPGAPEVTPMWRGPVRSGGDGDLKARRGDRAAAEPATTEVILEPPRIAGAAGSAFGGTGG
jgi:GNAT superfamily N-acetyltransferase